MSMQLDIAFVANNDVTCNFAVTLNNDPFNITGYTSHFYLKASRTASDGSGITITPTVTNAIEGKLSVFIPRTDVATAGAMWYRLDLVDGSGDISTAFFGNITVLSA
jgi:hypothetical protein